MDAWQEVLKNEGFIHQVIFKEFMWIVDRQHVMDKEDLVQYGKIGFYYGAQRFDPKKGFKLLTYCYHWIKQAIQRAYHAEGFKYCRVPVNQHEKLNSLMKKSKNLDIDSLYFSGEMTKETYTALKVLSQENFGISFDQEISNDTESKTTIGEVFLSADWENHYQQLEQREMEAFVETMLGTLTQRQAEILRKRYGLYSERMTLDEVGNEFNLSRERIRQIEVRALSDLKQRFKTMRVFLPETV